MSTRKKKARHLVVILGDQLDKDSAAFDGYDIESDCVWMAEASEESTHVWSHKQRIVLFLSAMRHFRDLLYQRKYYVDYHELGEGSLSDRLRSSMKQLKPEKVIMVEAGDYRVREAILSTCRLAGVPLEVRTDRHFISTLEDFKKHATGRKQLRMEFFYREIRKRTGILMEDGQPVGGKWNYDASNRASFGKKGPQDLPDCALFQPDKTTREVISLVKERFADHPGSLDKFIWPVTREQALKALKDFIKFRLPDFGKFQDAMWSDEPFLYHARLSSSLNLKLLNPREVIEAAEEAGKLDQAPLEAVEGFIRQILGWREYIRGIYWLHMPEYKELNALEAAEPLPDFYWTGDTSMECMKQAIGQTLDFAYAHHIQRLMVTGLYALLLGVRPQAVHEWYLAVYIDAVEWVELPNVLGMSQFADGGIMASKPYSATGKYIQRMSNYCSRCPFNPAESTGESSCPFTTLYWDFLLRHEALLKDNQRMSMQLRNLQRLNKGKRAAISRRASEIRKAPAQKQQGQLLLA